MANLTITAANIVPATTNVFRETVTVDLAVTAGQALYKTGSGAYRPGDATVQGRAEILGIALNNGAANQPVEILRLGSLAFGAILDQGMVYVLSATATSGAIAPYGDLVGGNYVTILGVATTTSDLQVVTNISGITT